MPGGYGEFELDIELVLKQQLLPFFAELTTAPLTLANVEALPPSAKGAYILFYDGVPVYAGKTDAEHGFRSRLERHFYCVQQRVDLDPALVSFKAARVMVFSNFDVEAILIKELRRENEENLSWNFSGFGSNDPGHNREGQKPAKFDVKYPVDVNRQLDCIEAGEQRLLELLVRLKAALPYLLRYDAEIADLRDTVVNVGDRSVLGVMRTIIACLPERVWQATIFPSKVILYHEHHDYQYARYIIRSGEFIEREAQD